MLSRYFAWGAIVLAVVCIYGGYSQQSALVLRDENSSGGSRYGSTSSGRYRGGVWVSSPTRRTYGSFRGGGPGAGK